MTSKKDIRGYLYSIAHQFDTSCEHIRYLMLEMECPVATIDFLTGDIATINISPPELATFRTQKLLETIKKDARKNILPKFDLNIIKAELSLEFTGAESVTTVIVEDAEQYVWSSRLVNDNPQVLP
ncbi:MAG: hypothetical protein ACK5NC_06150 [Vibrio sp.]